jgi:hypothetical protein
VPGGQVADWQEPPTHVFPVGQLQLSVPPQPLEIEPHAPLHVVSGTQAWQEPLAHV